MIKNSMPSAYLNGYVEFYKLRFKVTPDVLIPRPETELLVDEVLSSIKYLVESNNKNKNKKEIVVLDIGTGSGNIAISIAKQLYTSNVGIRVIATDVSEKALKVAQFNAKYHKVSDKIEFIQSDLLSAFNYPLHPKPYLIIVTNLPYIPTSRIPFLDPSVKDYEPHLALDGGSDGFELYRKLFKQLKQLLITHSVCNQMILIGEIDYTHGELAQNEALKYFPKAQVEINTDLAHKQRILLIRQFL